MAEIVHLNREPRFTKTCLECRFRIGNVDEPFRWSCGFSGYSCTSEEEGTGNNCCGPQKQFWMPRPPEDPPRPGFWARLGDAIIERVKGQ
jgi:hypothetical protein